MNNHLKVEKVIRIAVLLNKTHYLNSLKIQSLMDKFTDDQLDAMIKALTAKQIYS